MAQDYVKMFLTKDGNTRISICYDEYAENPRDMTDEPLHCEDWSRDYTIMNRKERESKSADACKLIRYLLERYGNTNEIIALLKANAKEERHKEDDNALMYDKSRHEWILGCWIEPWKDYNGAIHGNKWSEEASFCAKLKDLTAWDLVSYLSDKTIEELCDSKYWTDGIKMMSYGFGYYGGVSFSNEVSTDCEGICWLEKDEFLKYSGCDEKSWKSKTLREMEFLIEEIEAWTENEVYGFVVEKRITSNIRKEYTNVERPVVEYDAEEWEHDDSCWGFYGKFNEKELIEEAGYKIEELTEV